MSGFPSSYVPTYKIHVLAAILLFLQRKLLHVLFYFAILTKEVITILFHLATLTKYSELFHVLSVLFSYTYKYCFIWLLLQVIVSNCFIWLFLQSNWVTYYNCFFFSVANLMPNVIVACSVFMDYLCLAAYRFIQGNEDNLPWRI